MNITGNLDKRRNEPYYKVVIPFLNFEEGVIIYPDINTKDQFKYFTYEGNLILVDRSIIMDNIDCLVELLAAPNGTL